MKRLLSLIAIVLFCGIISAAEWSFGGGYIYFDNSKTKWQDECIMLIIGKSSWSGVYEMMLYNDSTYYCALPESGWGDAEYMAVIGGSSLWTKGGWGSSNLTNATHYSAPYTAGLKSTAGQGFSFTPQSTNNGCTLTLTYLGEGYQGLSFETIDKNNCYRIDEAKNEITFIFSTSSKRFNISKSNISKVYVYGSITAWNDKDEDYRLNGYSADGCFYRTFPLSAIERVGNSGQPEFLFHVYETNGSNYTVKSNPNWEGGIDKRLIFVNSGENMMVALPGDDLDELYARCQEAKEVHKLSQFDLTEVSEQLRISNFRRVPGTRQLYRSYHPYDPSRPQYDTEERRLYYVAKNAERAGIRTDLALSGNESSRVGKTYSCGGKTYTIAIPTYYQSIVDNNNVLYVGEKSGKTPSYNSAVFESDSKQYAEWMKELVEYVNDDAHTGPFQIHCALGSDRTGSFSAMIAALCGASWEEIARDYEATSNLKVQEYRHRNCIRYCIRHLAGVDPATDPSFGEAVRAHFVDGGYLTEEQIDKMVAKLNKTNSITYSVAVPAGTPQCYIAASWSDWQPVRMDKVDDTHYTLTVENANASQGYKYLCGADWQYEECTANGAPLSANRVYATVDNVVAWKSAANKVNMPTYAPVTIRVYSPAGAPQIWWWGGGDRTRSAAENAYVWSARPLMQQTEEKDWYGITFPEVDTAVGVNYNITIPGKEKSDDFIATASECRTDDYSLIACADETAVSESVVSPVVTTRKQLLNGQLQIIHNGITYDVMGNVVE